LLELKRRPRNGRPFRMGCRWGKTPYELQGLHLSSEDWWE
jgi:hypothetical protein